MINFLYKDTWFKLGFLLILVGVVFTSFYKLSESPATWTDEGLIVQTAQNLAGQGIYGFQIAPSTLISPSFISTSFPVTYPIALSFYLFGIDLLSARIVMAFYIIFLVTTVFFLFKNKIKEQLILTLLLVGSFPPLYGHGKNVLGEVPGVFFILLSALFLKLTEEGRNNLRNLSFFALFFGLAVVTKPIFILAVPGFLFVVLRVCFNNRIVDFRKLGVLFGFSLLPVVVWIFTQFFATDGWLSIIHYYSNPHSVDIISAIVTNLKDFFSNIRTLFAGGVFLLWTITLIYNQYNKNKIPLFEVYLYSLSLLVFILYFRNPPYYRYFFISEILSLAFLTSNVFYFSFGKLRLKNGIRVFLGLLLIFQIYQLSFDSWVADSYESHKTETMQSIIGVIPSNQTVFFYQAPEAVIFLKHFNYYQYFSGTVVTEFGQESLATIKDRNDLIVISRKDLFLGNNDLFSGYKIMKEFDRYVWATK